jgi:transcriptional regulator with XRE-family HTH domain
VDEERQKEVKKRFGARLRELRKAKNLSQEAVALASELDRSYVGRIERGQANLSLVNIQRVAEALGVQAGELFG